MRTTSRPLALLAVLVGVAGAARPAPAGAQPIDVRGLGHGTGDPSAPIQVVEFSDFSCPQCRVFHASTQDSLRARFVDTGKAYWITIPYASGMYPRSEMAAAASECAAEQGRHEAMRDRLYDRQAEWSSASADAARRLFVSYARDLDLDASAFAGCIDGERTRSRIESARRLADAVGVRGTPTCFIDGFPALGALPFPFIRDMFDRRLRELRQADSRRSTGDHRARRRTHNLRLRPSARVFR